MTLEARDDGALRVLVATGELDAAVVPELLDTLPSLVAGAAGVALDLTSVTFFDSSGVRLVDRLTRTCARASTGFVVVAPRAGLPWRVLDLVGFGGQAVEDVAAARARLLG